MNVCKEKFLPIKFHAMRYADVTDMAAGARGADCAVCAYVKGLIVQFAGAICKALPLLMELRVTTFERIG